MGSELLGIGLAGKSLTDLERRILAEHSPYAIVLFGRNIHDVVQLRQLIAEVKSISKRAPLFMIDEEGGRVDRLRHLVPGLPAVEAFGEGARGAEMSEWLGKVIGMALRYFDIECDLAPVVDIRGEHAPKGLERRTFGDSPEAVVELAGAFMRGLHGTGTASCPKHFPGIGLGSADSHYGATVIDISLDELVKRDLVPFARLGNEAGAVMIGHGAYPQLDDPDLPATLSYGIATRLLREAAGFKGLAVSDDIEMHAVSDLGSYEEISERALMAGNDVILICSHIERIPNVQRYLSKRCEEDAQFRARVDEAKGRAERYREHCNQLRAAAGPPPRHFDELIEEAIRFVDAFRQTRTHEVVVPDVDRRQGSRHPGTGRSGREEWT
jgi:beta-N-acetylhexosaminidase